VAPADIEEWIAPLRGSWDLQIAVLRERSGEPIAWSIAGTRLKNAVHGVT
jgi:hypothetical protein